MMIINTIFIKYFMRQRSLESQNMAVTWPTSGNDSDP